MTDEPLRSGTTVPSGEYASVGHADSTPCRMPARQLTALGGQVLLPKCRCGEELLWRAARGSAQSPSVGSRSAG